MSDTSSPSQLFHRCTERVACEQGRHDPVTSHLVRKQNVQQSITVTRMFIILKMLMDICVQLIHYTAILESFFSPSS